MANLYKLSDLSVVLISELYFCIQHHHSLNSHEVSTHNLGGRSNGTGGCLEYYTLHSYIHDAMPYLHQLRLKISDARVLL